MRHVFFYSLEMVLWKSVFRNSRASAMKSAYTKKAIIFVAIFLFRIGYFIEKWGVIIILCTTFSYTCVRKIAT